MPAGNHSDHSKTPPEQQPAATATALAQQIRKELTARSEVAVPSPKPPCLRLVYDLETVPDLDGKGADMTLSSPEKLEREVRAQPITMTLDELKRLQRIVQMLTIATGELNLWLANVGHDPVEIEL